MNNVVERCIKCGLFASQDYGAGYYLLNDKVYCSVSCFSEDDKKRRETIVTKPVVKKKSKKKVKKRNGR